MWGGRIIKFNDRFFFKTGSKYDVTPQKSIQSTKCINLSLKYKTLLNLYSVSINKI